MNRLLNNKLPTDEALQRYKVHGPSKCICCNEGHTENIDHLFREGELANAVWDYFSNYCGITINQGRIRNTLMIWWLSGTKNIVYSVFIYSLPIFICWEIWKARCSHKYEDIKSYPCNIISLVIQQIKMLLSVQFPKVIIMQHWTNFSFHIERLKPRINIKCLRWSKPSPGRFKLNTDGCSKGNPGSAGGGGVLRDDKGQLIMAYAEYFGDCSNNIAESKAILKGIQWCITNGCFNVDVESDSLLIINMINDHDNVNWQIMHLVNQINNLKNRGNFTFQHCYREVNNLANYLANLGENKKQCLFFTQNLTLPNGVKNWLKNDIDGTPTFRIRAQKKLFDNG